MTDLTNRPLPLADLLESICKSQEAQNKEMEEQTRLLNEIIALLDFLASPGGTTLSVLQRMVGQLDGVLKSQTRLEQIVSAGFQDVSTKLTDLQQKQEALALKVTHIINSLNLDPEA